MEALSDSIIAEVKVMNNAMISVPVTVEDFVDKLDSLSRATVEIPKVKEKQKRQNQLSFIMDDQQWNIDDEVKRSMVEVKETLKSLELSVEVRIQWVI